MKRTVSMAALAALMMAGLPSAAQAEGPAETYLVVTTTGAPAVSDISTFEARPGVDEIVTTLDGVGAAVVTMTPAAAKRLDADPNLVVSPDGVAVAGLPTDPVGEIKPGGEPLSNPLSEVAPSESYPAGSWGIDRIDARTGLDGRYNTRPGVTGAGVHAYVIDTGMDLDNPEFAGRVGNGVDYIDGGTAEDCHGHGTHVAGTIGSSTYGIARKAILHPVRVLDCSGSGYYSQIISGFNWVANNAPANSVANASLGGGYNAAVNQAADNLVNRGVPFAVAAGNSGSPIQYYSPASAGLVTTVMASDDDDGEAYYSNYGPESDMFGPGTNICSTRMGGGSCVLFSGTSMASPHVAGYMALRLQHHGSESVASTKAAMYSHSTKDVIDEYFPGQYRDDLIYVYSVVASSPPPARPAMKVKVQAIQNRSKLRVDVDPNQGSAAYLIKVQKKQGAKWTTKRTTVTWGPKEIRVINMPRGRYRVVVPAQYGYPTKASRAVTLRR